jgi:hypothetical protein
MRRYKGARHNIPKCGDIILLHAFPRAASRLPQLHCRSFLPDESTAYGTHSVHLSLSNIYGASFVTPLLVFFGRTKRGAILLIADVVPARCALSASRLMDIVQFAGRLSFARYAPRAVGGS